MPNGHDRLRSILRTLTLGTAVGALWLGVGGRVAMRLFAMVTARSGAFTVRGTLVVVFAGAVAGLAGGALRAILERPLRRLLASIWGRALVFGLLFFLLLSPGIRPPRLLTFALFAVCFAGYAAFLEALLDRYRDDVPRVAEPSAGNGRQPSHG